MKYAVIILLLLIPMIPTFWAIIDIAYKDFGSIQRKALWAALAIFVPCIGGIIYLLIGRKQGKKQGR